MTKVSSPVEGSPFTPRQVRLLKISIAIMTALLILGIVALVYGMVRQGTRLGTNATPAAGPGQQQPYSQSLNLGEGELKEVTASNGLIILHWKANTSDIIVTFDGVHGRELGRIQVPQP